MGRLSLTEVNLPNAKFVGAASEPRFVQLQSPRSTRKHPHLPHILSSRMCRQCLTLEHGPLQLDIAIASGSLGEERWPLEEEHKRKEHFRGTTSSGPRCPSRDLGAMEQGREDGVQASSSIVTSGG